MITKRVNESASYKKQFGNLLPELKKLTESNATSQQAFDHYIEMIYSGPSSLMYLRNFVSIIENETKLKESGKWEKSIESLKTKYTNFINAKEAIEYERNMWLNMYPVLVNTVDDNYLPNNMRQPKQMLTGAESSINRMFDKSMLLNEGKLLKRLNKLSARNIKKIKKDPAYIMAKDFSEVWSKKIIPNYYAHRNKSEALMKDYSKAIQTVFPDKNYWYDANSTLRVSYGQIEGSAPRDGMKYTHYTTANGIMAKYIPGNDEFDVPEKLVTLIENKDFGKYANGDNDLVICFTGSNHTTGGNSGSPVINGNGELIGINFDRSWESTMSDVMFSEKLCRNITVDIRYVLFVIDKYADCTRLIEEMDLVLPPIKSAKLNKEKVEIIEKSAQKTISDPVEVK